MFNRREIKVHLNLNKFYKFMLEILEIKYYHDGDIKYFYPSVSTIITYLGDQTSPWSRQIAK